MDIIHIFSDIYFYTHIFSIFGNQNDFSSSFAQLRCAKKKERTASWICCINQQSLCKEREEKCCKKERTGVEKGWKTRVRNVTVTLRRLFQEKPFGDREDSPYLYCNELFSFKAWRILDSVYLMQSVDTLSVCWSFKKSGNIHLWDMRMKEGSKGRHFMCTLSWYIKSLCSKCRCKLRNSLRVPMKYTITSRNIFFFSFSMPVLFYPDY